MTGRRGETWQRRIPNTSDYDPDLFNSHAENKLWVTIKNPESMDTGDSEDTEVSSFTTLTPGQKYHLIKSVCKPIDTMMAANGQMNIKVNESEIEQLLATTQIKDTEVLIEKHKTLNLIRGELNNRITIKMPEKEIIDELAEYWVTDVRKEEKPQRDKDNKFVKNDNNEIIYVPTGKVILTLEREALPPKVKLLWESCDITQHEPDPVQCKKCYDYNHTKKWCSTAVAICGWCSSKKHCETGQRCQQTPVCRHCKDAGRDSDHPAFSRKCPRYILEKDIAYRKETQKIPYWKAKKLAEGTDTEGTRYKSKLIKASETTLQNLIEANNAAIEDTFNNLIQNFQNRLEEKMKEILNKATNNFNSFIDQRIEQCFQTSQQNATDQLLSRYKQHIDSAVATIPLHSVGATDLFTSGGLSKQSSEYKQMMTEEIRMKRDTYPPTSPRDRKKSKTSEPPDPGA